MTVSRVVNERPGVGQRTRERVRQAIESLGYRPNIVARGLRAASSRTIGLIVPDVTNPYFPEIVRGAEDVAIEHGYTLLLANGIEDVARETESLRTFEDHLVDGVILCSPRLEDQELGLELPPSRVLPCPPTVEGGARAAREMLARDPEVDALLCFNDLVAAGALQALQELGIAVPREIAVTGYDDIVFARMFTPGLTTIRAPTYELGQQAGRMLIDRMHGRGYGVNIVLQPELVVRGSTAGFSPRAARRRASAARS